MAGPATGPGVGILVVSTISRSSQSTPLTLEQKSRRSAGSSRRNSAISLAWSAPSRRECWAAGPGFRTIATEEPGKRARMRSRICSGVSMAAGRLGSLLAGEDGRLPERGVLGRLEVVLAELRHRGVARPVGLQGPGRIAPGDRLPADLLLQLHQAVQQRLGPRGAARNVDVDRDIAVDALEHIVARSEEHTSELQSLRHL